MARRPRPDGHGRVFHVALVLRYPCLSVVKHGHLAINVCVYITEWFFMVFYGTIIGLLPDQKFVTYGTESSLQAP